MGMLPSLSVSVEMADTSSLPAESDDKEGFAQVFVKEEAHLEEEATQMVPHHKFYGYASRGEDFVPYSINCPTSRFNMVSTRRGLKLGQSAVWPTQTFAASVVNNSKKKSEERMYACDICTETFAHVSSLNIHKQIHKPFTCSQCGKSFTFISNLKQHLRNHAGDLPFVCKVCSKGFMFQCRLEQHETIHVGNKSFECTECGKGFTRKSILKTHKMSHSGLKSFRCIECGKGFTLRSHLNRHIKTHTGEKPFFCAECGKNFTDKSNFIRHVKRHTNADVLTCNECGTNFSDKSYYSRHRKKHIQKSEALLVTETNKDVLKNEKDCAKLPSCQSRSTKKGNTLFKGNTGTALLRATCKTIIDNIRKASKCIIADHHIHQTNTNSHNNSSDKMRFNDSENVSKDRTTNSTVQVNDGNLEISFFSNIMHAVVCKDEPASSEDEDKNESTTEGKESDSIECLMPLDMRINPT